MALDAEPWFLPVRREREEPVELTERRLWTDWHNAWNMAQRWTREVEAPTPISQEVVVVSDEEMEDCFITKVVGGVPDDDLNDPDWLPSEDEVIDLTHMSD
jgi:hypothetical protein